MPAAWDVCEAVGTVGVALAVGHYDTDHRGAWSITTLRVYLLQVYRYLREQCSEVVEVAARGGARDPAAPIVLHPLQHQSIALRCPALPCVRFVCSGRDELPVEDINVCSKTRDCPVMTNGFTKGRAD